VATMMLEIPDALKPMWEPLRDLLAGVQAQVDRERSLGRDASGSRGVGSAGRLPIYASSQERWAYGSSSAATQQTE
jgi:hypothetical protein